MSDDWSSLTDRAKRQLEVKTDKIFENDDLPDRRLDEDFTRDELTETIRKAAREPEEPPEPTNTFKVRNRLAGEIETRSELLESLPVKVAGGVLGGATGFWEGLGLANKALDVNRQFARPVSPDLVGDLGLWGILGSTVLGVTAPIWGRSVAQKSARKLRPQTEMQNTMGPDRISAGSGKSVETGLESFVGDSYALRCFRHPQFGDSVELSAGLPEVNRLEDDSLDSEGIRRFLSDIEDEAEVEWRVKRREGRPLQVMGVRVDYGAKWYADTDTYERRERLANEVAEEAEGVLPDDVLSLDSAGETDRRVPTTSKKEQFDLQGTLEMAVVGVNPEYTLGIAEDYEDHSDALDTVAVLENNRDPMSVEVPEGLSTDLDQDQMSGFIYNPDAGHLYDKRYGELGETKQVAFSMEDVTSEEHAIEVSIGADAHARGIDAPTEIVLSYDKTTDNIDVTDNYNQSYDERTADTAGDERDLGTYDSVNEWIEYASGNEEKTAEAVWTLLANDLGPGSYVAERMIEMDDVLTEKQER